MLKYCFKEAILLFGLWIILSGRFELKYLLFGIAASALVSWISLPLQRVSDIPGEKGYWLLSMKFSKLAGYWIWLFFEIVKSSWNVAKAVMSPQMKINPHTIEFVCPFSHPVAVTTLVNSIILTPGTVTLNVQEGNRFVVHVLTDRAAEGLLEGSMQRHIAELFEVQEERSI